MSRTVSRTASRARTAALSKPDTCCDEIDSDSVAWRALACPTPVRGRHAQVTEWLNTRNVCLDLLLLARIFRRLAPRGWNLALPDYAFMS